MPHGIQKVVSGGQTGADRAALDAAMEAGIHYGGWVPKGRLAEDGKIPVGYDSLTECDSRDYVARTELNVENSDATLIVSHGPLTGGSKLTQDLCRKHRRPYLHIDLRELDESEAAEELSDWLRTIGCRVLNVAGPRASEDPNIYGAVKRLLHLLFRVRT